VFAGDHTISNGRMMVRFDEREPADYSLRQPFLAREPVDAAASAEVAAAANPGSAHHGPPGADDDDDDDENDSEPPSRLRQLIEQTPDNFITRFRQRLLAQNQSAEQSDDRSSAAPETRSWKSILANPSLTNVTLLALYMAQIFLIWISLASAEWLELRIRLPFHADFPFKTFGLAQLLQEMYFAEFGPPTILLWVFSLVVPSLFTIFAPSFFLHGSSSRTPARGRVVFETLQHAPFAAIYIMNLLAVVHDIESSDAALYLHAKPPIAAFAFGTICSMIFVSILRLKQGIPKAGESINHATDDPDRDDDESVPMRILEDVPPISPVNEASQYRPKVAFWKKFVILQLGLLSMLLWLPVFFFPFCTVKVDSGWIRVLERDVTLGQVLLSLPASMMVVPAVLGPLAATIAAFAAWMVDEGLKVHVYALRPWIGSINLGLTLWGVIHLVPMIMEVQAMSVHVHASWGLYISLVQAVCTELLVMATLSWLP
jgi:hypothetical protein